jgi:hypothetical protein
MLNLGTRGQLFWRLQAIGWAAILLVSAGMVHYLPMKDAFILAVLRSVFGLLITSFALRPLLRWIRRTAPSVLSRFGLIASCCLFGGMADTYIIGKAARLLDPSHTELLELRQFLPISILIRTNLYGLWSALYFGIHYWIDTQQQQLRAARAEAALRVGELQMLRSQVNPHFLFNALNSILAATEQPPVARKITLALADYLRFSLQQRGNMEQLSVEVSALESYLQVEKSRFEMNLEYCVDTPAPALQTIVPVAIIQPLLENALKYGGQSTIRPLKIAIRAGIERETLTLSVTNSGHWIEPGLNDSTGIGLANLRRRLHLLYGDSATLVHESSPSEVTARIRLPLTCPFPIHGPSIESPLG